jgi:hypothetical protein
MPAAQTGWFQGLCPIGAKIVVFWGILTCGLRFRGAFANDLWTSPVTCIIAWIVIGPRMASTSAHIATFCAVHSEGKYSASKRS